MLISSGLLQLVTGLLNTLQYYPWKWSFVSVHYWLGYVLIGSLLLHIAVKLPIVRRGLSTSVKGPLVDEEGLTRRGALTGIGVGVVGLTTVGQAVGPLAKLSLLSTRRVDQAPIQDFPVNRPGSSKIRQIV